MFIFFKFKPSRNERKKESRRLLKKRKNSISHFSFFFQWKKVFWSKWKGLFRLLLRPTQQKITSNTSSMKKQFRRPGSFFVVAKKNKFAINTFEKLLRVFNNFVCWLWDVSGGFQNNFKLAEFDDACKTFFDFDWYGSFLSESHYLIPTLNNILPPEWGTRLNTCHLRLISIEIPKRSPI